MPTYLFTFHAYLSWLPDRAQGHVERERGVLPPDADKADLYRRNASEDGVIFDRRIQRLLIDEALNAAEHQQFTIHAIGTDSTHAHVLMSWSKAASWKKVQAGLRQSLTRRLNKELGRRPWFTEDGSHKHVGGVAHDAHLRTTYLPKHNGLGWP